MSRAIIERLDRNSVEVRRRLRSDQAPTIDQLAALMAHVYGGLDLRGQKCSISAYA